MVGLSATRTAAGGDGNPAAPAAVPSDDSLAVFLESVRLENEKLDQENAARALELIRSATELTDALSSRLSEADFRHAKSWVESAIAGVTSPPAVLAPGAGKPLAASTATHRRTWIEDCGYLFKSRAALAEWERLVCAGVPWAVAAAAVGAVEKRT